MIEPLQHPNAAVALPVVAETKTEMETTDELEARVSLIVSTLGNSYRDFGLASETYNSVFFRDEDPAFVRSLCLGLMNHFSMWPNTCWIKLTNQASV